MKMAKEEDYKELLKLVLSNSLRITAMERVLQSEGVITRERYIEELKACAAETKSIEESLQRSSSKVLS